jgi:hypothetical protein
VFYRRPLRERITSPIIVALQVTPGWLKLVILAGTICLGWLAFS